MNDRRSEDRNHPTDDLLDSARKLADGADSWFVSVARGFGRAARWSRDEANVVAEAAAAAARTTSAFARGTVSSIGKKFRPDADAALEDALERLGRRVAAARTRDYGSLRNDEDFWRLVMSSLKLRAVRLEQLAQEQRAAEGAAARRHPTRPPARKPAKSTPRSAQPSVESAAPLGAAPEQDEPDNKPAPASRPRATVPPKASTRPPPKSPSRDSSPAPRPPLRSQPPPRPEDSSAPLPSGLAPTPLPDALHATHQASDFAERTGAAESSATADPLSTAPRLIDRTDDMPPDSMTPESSTPDSSAAATDGSPPDGEAESNDSPQHGPSSAPDGSPPDGEAESNDSPQRGPSFD